MRDLGERYEEHHHEPRDERDVVFAPSLCRWSSRRSAAAGVCSTSAPDAVRALLRGFDDVRIDFVGGRYVRLSPRLFARDLVFAAAAPAD